MAFNVDMSDPKTQKNRCDFYDTCCFARFIL